MEAVSFQPTKYGWRSKCAIASHLIENGANLNLQDKRGLTALMHAVSSREEPVCLLIKGGAKLDIQDEEVKNLYIKKEKKHQSKQI